MKSLDGLNLGTAVAKQLAHLDQSNAQENVSQEDTNVMAPHIVGTPYSTAVRQAGIQPSTRS
jgi:hypothetical protein